MQLTDILNAKALQYAELILAALPPKQADIHRQHVQTHCDLLLRDAGATARFEFIEDLATYFKSSAVESQTIMNLANLKFFKSVCDPAPLSVYETVDVRDELMLMFLSHEGRMLAEIVFRYLESQQASKDAPPRKVPDRPIPPSPVPQPG